MSSVDNTWRRWEAISTWRRVIDCLPHLDGDSREVDPFPLSECTHVIFTKDCFDMLGAEGNYGRLAHWISESEIGVFCLDGVNLATPALRGRFWDKVAECPYIQCIAIANTTIADDDEHYYAMQSIITTTNLKMLSFVDCDIQSADIGVVIQWREREDEDLHCEGRLRYLAFEDCRFDNWQPDDLIAFARNIGEAKLCSVSFVGCHLSENESFLFQGVIRCKCAETVVIVNR